MAAAAASGNNLGHATAGLDIVSAVKGAVGNLVTVKVVKDPAGATGASTCVETGLAVVVNAKNDGNTTTETLAGLITALATGKLVTATLHAAATGANTGVDFSATALSGGADATGGGIYDDLAAATGDGWKLATAVAAPAGTSAHGGVDILEKVISTGPGQGIRIKAVGDAVTGAQNAVNAAGRIEARYYTIGTPRVLKAVGATGANEYLR